MEEIDEKQKAKLIASCTLVIVLSYLVAHWLPAQLAARELGYHELLPGLFEFPAQYGIHIYKPFTMEHWRSIPDLYNSILETIRPYVFLEWGIYAVGGITCYSFYKQSLHMTSHGTAGWAKKEDIKNAGLAEVETGFVCGINPYTKELMMHNGKEHILLCAPTRSGKGVCCIIPTAVTWKHSAFFFDPKGELWHKTSAWRKHHYKQKVMKFEPLCMDGSAAKWNPFAEIDFQSFGEMSDVATISEMMVKTGEGAGKDPFWENSAAALLNGVILHLMYKHFQEKRVLPCPSDVMSFLSSPGTTLDVLFASMEIYPHITKEEFLEINGKKNVLKENYGEYIGDFRPFAKVCPQFAAKAKANEEQARRYEEALAEGREEQPPQSNLELLRETVLELEAVGEKIDFSAPEIFEAKDKKEINAALSSAQESSPWFQLLVHPKVAESAANMYNGAEQTRASIMQTAQTSMSIYQDPLVRKNTSVSDFSIRDLLDPSQTISLYLVVPSNDIERLRPLNRLFVDTMLNKLMREMKFDKAEAGKQQRLLMLLDEFPQLKKMDSIERALGICAGYGIKICIVVQNMGQINQLYTKDNAIPGNCHVQIYFTPALEDGGGTAKTLSDMLGEKTIHTTSKSSNGKMFESSTSTSQMARKLMTPDEVLRMPPDKVLVRVAGFRTIYGDKLEYYKKEKFGDFFMRRTDEYLEAPAFSDIATKVQTFAQLFEVHRADREEIELRQQKVAKARAASEKQQETKKEAGTASEKQQETKENESNEEITEETKTCNESPAGIQEDSSLRGDSESEDKGPASEEPMSQKKKQEAFAKAFDESLALWAEQQSKEMRGECGSA